MYHLASCCVTIIDNVTQLIFPGWYLQFFCQTCLRYRFINLIIYLVKVCVCWPSCTIRLVLLALLWTDKMLILILEIGPVFTPYLPTLSKQVFCLPIDQLFCAAVLSIVELTRCTACEGVVHRRKRDICIITDTTSDSISERGDTCPGWSSTTKRNFFKRWKIHASIMTISVPRVLQPFTRPIISLRCSCFIRFPSAVRFLVE